MTPEELDETMGRLERLWPASKFRDLDELDTWRHHLAPHPHTAVAQVLAVFASSGQYKRFRPDLPPILSALGTHARALNQAERSTRRTPKPAPSDLVLEDPDLDADWRAMLDPSDLASVDLSLERTRELRDRLRHKSSA